MNVLGSGLERTCAATIQEWQFLAKKEREWGVKGVGLIREKELEKAS